MHNDYVADIDAPASQEVQGADRVENVARVLQLVGGGRDLPDAFERPIGRVHVCRTGLLTLLHAFGVTRGPAYELLVAPPVPAHSAVVAIGDRFAHDRAELTVTSRAQICQQTRKAR